MDYLPIFVDLNNKPCLVVGGGGVALRKTRQLLQANARVLVNAPQLHSELQELVRRELITHQATKFEPKLISRHFLIVAATDDTAVNNQVFQSASQAKRLVNSVDDPKRSNFVNPAVVDRSPVVVAISSGGAAPVLVRRLREKLEAELPKRLGQLALVAKKFRPRVKALFETLSQRRRFWEDTLSGPVASHVFSGRLQQAEETLEQSLSHTIQTGSVALVGAGPGDANLMTLRGLQWLQIADVVLYDRLVSKEVLGLGRRDAEMVFVGKKPGCHNTTQAQIIEKMIEYATAGLRVCRLKGGDPFIFGRGGEELQAMKQAGIPFEVVPGITAASGASAYGGIPLTHRDYAQSVRFVTGHCQASIDCLDWPSLAQEKQTLVFYMSVGKLELLEQKMVQHGRSPDTPIAFVENATRDKQRVITATLGLLSQTAKDKNIVSPSILIVGKVAGLANELSWFKPRSTRLEIPETKIINATTQMERNNDLQQYYRNDRQHTCR